MSICAIPSRGTECPPAGNSLSWLQSTSDSICQKLGFRSKIGSPKFQDHHEQKWHIHRSPSGYLPHFQSDRSAHLFVTEAMKGIIESWPQLIKGGWLRNPLVIGGFKAGKFLRWIFHGHILIRNGESPSSMKLDHGLAGHGDVGYLWIFGIGA